MKHVICTTQAHGRRGFAIVVVLLAVAIAAAVLMALQSSAYRQAAAGREAVARVRAKWAARAGLEATIARFEHEIERGEPVTGFDTIDQLSEVASGTIEGARWTIQSSDGGRIVDAPDDPHARVNINRMSVDDMLQLEGMTEDVAAAIVDWRDPDELVTELGAERGAYVQQESSRLPRNGFIKSLHELELVMGVDPELVRGEDWNLNGRLDPNEDDGEASWPPDNADGDLDGGWSAIITADSIDEGLAVDGQERLYLPETSKQELAAIVDDLSPLQVDAILAYSARAGIALTDFIGTPLPTLALATGQFNTSETAAMAALTRDQIQQLIDSATLYDPEDGPIPGRININMVREEVLDYVEPFRDNPSLIDRLMAARNARAQGFVKLTDLQEYLGPQQLAQLARYIDVQSNAYVVVSRGRDLGSGLEVELRATIERTALPVVITEMTVR
ncbi:MAG: general secretion pathway protein GspK [Phycisphaerales bacterium]|nr:general secretion pathway protein GspK [Phycisphaerales bacterium]